MKQVLNEELIKLAVLSLGDKKYLILDKLRHKSYQSMDLLAKDIKMSLPRLAYHIRGNLESEGLERLGLILIVKSKHRNIINISPLGLFLLIEKERFNKK